MVLREDKFKIHIINLYHKCNKLYRKKYIVYTTLAIILVTTLTFTFAFAGTGNIRIEPPLPIATESPAHFKVNVTGKDNANDPHVFLVITESCYLTSPVANVSWDGGFIVLSSWNMNNTNSAKLPPGASNGAGYTVASLKSHLNTPEPIYWSMASILGGSPIVPGEIYDLRVELDSDDPEMLVYVMGKSGSGEFDMRVPPTIPGFVIPEIPLGSLSALLTMAASAVYYLRKK
jgi:hypothetical protein